MKESTEKALMDNLTKEARSENMSKIRSHDTVPEEIVRKYLHSKGLRYRKNDKKYPGKPDVVLRKYRTVVFVNGCFWHCHTGCKEFSLPKSNTEFWTKKLQKNVERDDANRSKLLNDGWNVIVVWECELKKNNRDIRLESLYHDIIATKC